MRHWIENVKNEGLIKYAVWFRERVLVTDTKTLGEVLVTKVCLLNHSVIRARMLTASRITSSSSQATSAKASRGFSESASY